MTTDPSSSTASRQSQFRLRLIILVLLILMILIFARFLTASQSPPASPASPLPVLSATTSPTATFTPYPTSLYTPMVTFSAIPPTFFPETHTIVPTGTSVMPNTPSPTPTPQPLSTLTSGGGCHGFGEDRGKEWIVAGCDTLERISQMTGISLKSLLAANPDIHDPNLIYPNQVIRLPGR